MTQPLPRNQRNLGSHLLHSSRVGLFCASPSLSHLKKKQKLVGNEKPQRRGSVGSLDSGMSISFQSTSASTGSRSDIKVNRMLSHSNTSGQIIMHAGQHPTALMGAIYHQQILQQQHPHPQPPPTQPGVMTTQPPQQNVVVTQPPQQLATGAIRRERKLSRPEEGATMAAAAASAPGSGANFGRSTEV